MEKSSFFNSVNRDRLYKAEDWAGYFASFIGNGFFADSIGALQVVHSGGMTVKIQKGRAFINGYFYENTDYPESLLLALPMAHASLKRIDRVVIRWDRSLRSICAAVRSSEPSAQPIPPQLRRDMDIYELAIADITVNAGATAINGYDISDLRLNTQLCGAVKGVVEQIDTTTFWNQLQSWFDEIQEYALQEASTILELIRGILGEDAAANLQLQIKHHADLIISDNGGVHGISYNDDMLKVKQKNGEWIELPSKMISADAGNSILLGSDNKLYSDMGRFIIRINFQAIDIGNPFTINGSGFVYSGVVPPELTVNVSAPYPNTAYIITLGATSKTVQTSTFFGIYETSINELITDFGSTSWELIASAVERGIIDQMGWPLGAEKDITLTTGEALTLQIYGFNHDTLDSGGKAGLTIGLKNLMAATRALHSSNTGVNIQSTATWTWLQNALFNSLPADLQPHIKIIQKQVANPSGLTTLKPKVFLPSLEEFGLTPLGTKDNSTLYPLFTDNQSRIKRLANGAGSASGYLTRSRIYTNATAYDRHYVTATGSRGGTDAGGNMPGNQFGVCFAFCI